MCFDFLLITRAIYYWISFTIELLYLWAKFIFPFTIWFWMEVVVCWVLATGIELMLFRRNRNWCYMRKASYRFSSNFSSRIPNTRDCCVCQVFVFSFFFLNWREDEKYNVEIADKLFWIQNVNDIFVLPAVHWKNAKKKRKKKIT